MRVVNISKSSHDGRHVWPRVTPPFWTPWGPWSVQAVSMS